MRALLGPILLHLLILLAGLGLLRVPRVVPRLWSMRALAAGGLAYMCGLSVALSVSILLLVLGVPFNLVTFALICVVLAAPLVLDLPQLVGLTPPVWMLRPRESWRNLSPEVRLVTLTLVVFGVIALIGMFTLSGQPIGRESYDAWNLWMRKASLLFFDSHLPVALLKSPAEGYIQAYYPLGYSMLLAVHMRAIGAYDTSTIHVVVWVLLIAFVWAGCFLASRVTRPLVWAILLPGAVFFSYAQASTGYADIPVAIFLCLTVLATGIWLQSGRRPDLLVALALLSGAVQIKNEGYIGAIIILFAAGCWLLVGRRLSMLRDLLAGAAAVVVIAILPWRLWLSAHHIAGDHSLGATLNPSYLIARFNRVWPSLKALESQMVVLSNTSVFIVIGLALVLLSLRGRARNPLSGFYLLTGVLYFLGLLAAYRTSPFGYKGLLTFYIPTSVTRIVPGGLAFICLAAVLHLSSVEWATRRQRVSPAQVAEPGAAAAPGEPVATIGPGGDVIADG